MKIAFIRYPEALYSSGKVVRGGSEIANQYIINYLKNNGVEVKEFAPQNSARLALIDIPAIGTSLLFQDLRSQVSEINKCDIVVTTNWFGLIMPEIERPIVTIFHSNANLMKQIITKDTQNDEVFSKWLNTVRNYGLGQHSRQDEHENIISIGEQYATNHSAGLIAVSDFLKQSLIKSYNIEPKKISVVYNPFPPEWNQVQAKNFVSGNLKVICVTRLSSDYNGFLTKGEDRIFDIMSQLPHTKRTLLASTPQGVFKEFMNSVLPEVHFFENASRDEVRDNLADSHISIHTSRCEAYGLSLVESMVVGNVPIVFPTGIAEELIKTGQNGFLVRTTTEALEIIKMLDQDRQRLESISWAARNSIITRLSVTTIGRQYRDMIESIMNNPPARYLARN